MLFLRRRKQNIVQNQAITGGIRVQTQIRFRVVHVMPIIFGVVAAVKRKKALAENAVEIADFGV